MNASSLSTTTKLFTLTALTVAASALPAQDSHRLSQIYSATVPFSTTVVQPEGSVLRVKLDTKLQSNVAHVDDKFTATIDMGKSKDYFGIPNGTKVEGHVSAVRAKEGKVEGMLALQPDNIVLADGTRYPITASMMKIDKKSVTKEKDGRLMAKTAYREPSNYIVTGAAVGVGIAAIAGGDLLAGGLLGAAIGFFIGQSRGQYAQDVTLKQGTVFGVRFDQDTPIEIAIN